MSNPEPSAGATNEPAIPQPDNAGLQFDRAEFSQPKSLKCSTCNEEIKTAYYQINEKNVCETCRGHAEALMTGGSGARRFFRALVFGTIAAVVGSGIYYLVSLTGYQIGLIAILVGFMVGVAVRAGSDNRGGLAYQFLAVFLTYTAIASSYAPELISYMKQQDLSAEMMAEEDEDLKVETAGAAQSDGSAYKADKKPEAKTVSAPAPAPKKQVEPEPVSFVEAIIGLGALIVLIYSIPVLLGMQSIIGLLIVGFGLYQAWSMNKRIQTEIKGPFSIPPADQGASPSGA